MLLFFYPQNEDKKGGRLSQIYQSEQGGGRKFDKLPHFSSSVPKEGVLSPSCNSEVI